jgi:hypothetical protein
MHHLKGILLLSLVSILLPVVLAEQSSGEEGAPPARIRTDRSLCPEPSLPTLPKAGAAFLDPTFGTPILRVTDESDGKFCNNAYSYWPSFNRDSTRFFICCDGKPMLYQFDPKAFETRGKQPLFPKRTPRGGIPRWEDAIWSGNAPDMLFCHEGLNLWSYNVATQTYTLVKTFNELPLGHLSQMSKSLDDNTFAFSVQNLQWKVVGFLAWRCRENKIVFQQNAQEGLDEVQVDKTGRYLVIKTGKQGRDVVEVRIADLNTGKLEDLTDNEPDFAPGHSDNGRGTVLGADNWRNRLTFRKLSEPHRFYSALDLGSDWSQDYHISMLADDERWALVSFYVGNSLPSTGVFRNEIVLVATDGSQKVRRLAHHRTVFKEYWDSPRANVSRDGRFALFTSNWGGRTRRDVFILRIP